jgi:anti-sigma-K factor RskA
MDQHLDADTAALAALGEPLSDPSHELHMASCVACQHEITELRSTVSVARSTVGEYELQAPPAHVWQSIRAELGLSRDLTPVTPSGAPSELERRATPIGEPISLDAARSRREVIRRFLAPVAASAAAAALITAAVVSWSFGAPRDQGVTVAAAQLDAFPAWEGAAGEATVSERPDGERVIRVALDVVVDDSVVREVWLLTESADGLISLGYLTGPTGEFVIPPSVDLARYSVVDVSAEPLDGDPTHSGDSIVRGALEV